MTTGQSVVAAAVSSVAPPLPSSHQRPDAATKGVPAISHSSASTAFGTTLMRPVP
jgi:hypothetical protein